MQFMDTVVILKGYGEALEAFDARIPEIVENMQEDDFIKLLQLTTETTQRSREQTTLVSTFQC